MNQTGARPPAQKSGAATALKFFAIGCLAMILLGGAAGYYLYIKAAELTRDFSATLIEDGTASMMRDMGLPQAEVDGAMAPLKALAQDIRDEKISLQRGLKIAEVFVEGHAFTALMMRGFEIKYLTPSALSDEEKRTAHVDITRFSHGLRSGTIDKAKGEQLRDLVLITTKDPASGSEQRRLKDSLTPEELLQCLTLMKDAADQASIENKEFPIDLADEYKKAIEKGMAEADKLEGK